MSTAKRTALHEAGHAVLFHFLEIGAGDVTIVGDKDEGSDGCALHGGEFTELRTVAEDAFWQRHAIACYGGAEALRRGRYRNWRHGAGPDMLQAWRAVAALSEDHESQVLLSKYLRHRTRLMVTHYWPEIKAVAQALLDSKDGTLSGETVVAIANASLVARMKRKQPRRR